MWLNFGSSVFERNSKRKRNCLIFMFINFNMSIVSYFLYSCISQRMETKYQIVHDESEQYSPLQSQLSEQTQNNRSVKSKERNRKCGFNIMECEPYTFLPQFKNPCWYDETNVTTLRCLPYFYIIGVKKSGTTDLFSRISRHPQFAFPGFKESQWLARRRFRQKGMADPEYYVSMFSNAAQRILDHPSILNRSVYYPLITADGSPSNLHLNTKWSLLPGNEGLAEPKYTNLDYLHHLTPNARIIIIMRDPVSRLYSDFLHTYHMMKRYSFATPAVFHNEAVKAMTIYSNCLASRSLRQCLYDESIWRRLPKFDFHASFYAFYMEELYRMFPSEHILPILMTDYTSHMEGTMDRVFEFLQMRNLTGTFFEKIILSTSIKNKRRHKKPMFKKTRTLLKNFFKPFNLEMAKRMNDSRYNFF